MIATARPPDVWPTDTPPPPVPIHALGCINGLSMGDREYPPWAYAGPECPCIDSFACPAPGCFGVLRVRSGPQCRVAQ